MNEADHHHAEDRNQPVAVGVDDESDDHEVPELRLSEQEKDWIWELIASIEGSGDEEEEAPEEDIKPLTDFEYAVYALVTEGNIQDAERRARGMQRFRETYNVQDTIEEGMAILEQFIERFPGVLLHMDVIGPHGSVVAWDFGSMFPARILASEENYRIFALSMYYITRIHNPTLEAIREGVYYLVEGNMTWENFDMTLETRFFHEIMLYDPVKLKHILVYNTNTITNVFFTMIKPLMTREMRRVLQLGCEIDPPEILGTMLSPITPKLTLQDIFIQPNFDVAMSNLLTKARTLLEMRYNNEGTFRV